MVQISSLTNPVIQSFISKPYIQHALQNVNEISSVLTFWFGVDTTTTFGKELLRTGSKECLSDMSPLWYGGGPEYDTLCQPFADLIHLAGTRSLVPTTLSPQTLTETSIETPTEIQNDWYATTDGNIAQVILIDQLARNVFRGTEYAFKYGDVALNISRQLSTQYLTILSEKLKSTDATEYELTFDTTRTTKTDAMDDPIHLVDDIFDNMHPPYSAFLATALMHSEEQCDHELCKTLLEHTICAAKNYGTTISEERSKELCDWFQYQLRFAIEHKEIIDRFGRYPHRNRLFNRISSDEELEWLSDVDKLPAWAKSQG